VESSDITLEQGEYTLCFSTKAPSLRGMTVSLGNADQTVIVPADDAAILMLR